MIVRGIGTRDCGKAEVLKRRKKGESTTDRTKWRQFQILAAIHVRIFRVVTHIRHPHTISTPPQSLRTAEAYRKQVSPFLSCVLEEKWKKRHVDFPSYVSRYLQNLIIQGTAGDGYFDPRPFQCIPRKSTNLLLEISLHLLKTFFHLSVSRSA